MSTNISGPATSADQLAAFESLCTEQSDEVAALARAARSLIVEVMPDVTEVIWPAQGTASYGVGPKKMSEHFVYFTFARKHLGFGFYYGADLDDATDRLQGTGKAMRRVKIASMADLDDDLRALVQAASRHLPKLKR